MKSAVFALCACISTAASAESEWRTSWDGTLYGYANSVDLRSDSVLNPGNQVAGLAQRSDVVELRLNFKAENETLRVTARPIASARDLRNESSDQRRNDTYLSQWQLRVRAAESWNVAAGRDVLNWGAAQFRSPSSPFYFDNGRSDPMRELVGMDVLKLSWTPDMQSSLSMARIVSSGYGAVQPDVWRDSLLVKFDQRGEGRAYGMVAVSIPHLPAFYGAHAQTNIGDAWMLYGETGLSSGASALQSTADATQPFTVQQPAARSSATLAGAAYTFENGTSLSTEYLHDNHGYTSQQESAYFQRATVIPGMALGLAPRLLGRDYLHMVWQSNMLGDAGYGRLMYTHQFTDGGNELAGYGEAVLNPYVSLFALAVLPLGSAQQEFSALFQRSVTVGLKISLP